MKFKYLFMVVGVILFLTGCETKLKDVLKQDPKYIEVLKHTHRGEILNSFETKAIIVASYLGDDKNQTRFLVGVYNIDESPDINKGGLFNKNYHLTLNDLNSSKISIINEQEARNMQLANYPFYQKWMKYYIVKFPQSTKPYNLIYKNNFYGQVKLTFQ